MKTVRVAAAVIRDGNRILATQRGYGPWKDGWEFPGGKIEAGETAEETVAREIREELEARIEVGKRLAQVEYDYPDFHLSMTCFLCTLADGGLRLREHEAARWLRREELGEVEWLPADRELVEALAKGTIF